MYVVSGDRIGVQGLADAFAKMRLPFESPQAMQLNKDIFETMYFAALQASNELAEKVWIDNLEPSLFMHYRLRCFG